MNFRGYRTDKKGLYANLIFDLQMAQERRDTLNFSGKSTANDFRMVDSDEMAGAAGLTEVLG